jgi:O-antigen/teichoic acid export membrane protein
MVKILSRKAKIIEKRDVLTEAILESEEGILGLLYPSNFKKRITGLLKNRKIFVSGGVFVVASLFANVLNYLFNTVAERILSFSDFSLIGLVGSFLSLASIIFGAYTFTVNYNSSFLIGKYGEEAAYSFWRHINKKSLLPSIIITAVWLLITPFLMNFFHTDNILLFVFFSLVLFVGFLNSANQGFLSAKLLFGTLAVLAVIDPLIRLSATAGLTFIGLRQWAFATMILSFLVVTYTSWVLLQKKNVAKGNYVEKSIIHNFPKKLFFVSIISGVSSVAYFTFDIFLAKHFLTPTEAGQYTLVSLVGKMVFFLGGLAGPFITPIVSRYEGAGKSSTVPFYIIMGITAFFSFTASLVFGFLGKFTLPLLYGEKAHIIVPYVPLFTLGMACYTVSGLLVSYYLVKKVYIFAIIPILLVFLQIGLIIVFHSSVQAIATVMSYVLMANLLVTLSLHFAMPFLKNNKKILFVINRLSLQ